MIRIVIFLIIIAVAAFAATWVGDQHGDVAISWSGWRAETTLPVFVLGLTLLALAAIAVWSVLRNLWQAPQRLQRRRRERRIARGRNAVTNGLLAIGHGDHAAARKQATVAKRLAPQDPLTLLLHAQSAQMDGDRDGAQRAFRAMTERKDTRLLGLRGLFIEAQRADDPHAAIEIAQEALKLSPASTWASQAVLGFRCAQGDWSGALTILDNNLAAGLLDKTLYQRQRAVLLTARALDLETSDRDRSRESAMEAVRLAPTLVPAAVLASKFHSEAQQVRRAMRIIEAAWLAQPHPDLADAYAHVKLGDSARQRLSRVESLAAKKPDDLEGALAVARAAIDASEFERARKALAPFIAAPTQRVAMLMAEIERTEHGDSGRTREWTMRAVRALHDPVWTADGYVSDHWRPVSPLTWRLDAFQWQMPLAALPADSHTALVVEADERDPATKDGLAALPAATAPNNPSASTPNSPPVASPAAETAPTAPAATEPPAAAAAPGPNASPAPGPLFRSRQLPEKGNAAAIPAVIPLTRAPDDPGVDEDLELDEYGEPNQPRTTQAGGWRGFLSRLGG
ncbi:MAG: heme biosynthesis protein HemY [Rhizobiales bacterium]|nr:heme biosynthesis protein HemY [Hyphomicrobiales bacterium]